MKHMGQRRLHQFPAGDALDGLRQRRGQAMELMFHQHSLKGLGREPKRRGISAKKNSLAFLTPVMHDRFLNDF